MVALKSQYHKQCFVALYTRSRQQPDGNQPVDSTPHEKAFSEILHQIENRTMFTSDCKVLKLSDIKKEYLTRLEELGAAIKEQSIHSKGETSSKPPRTKCTCKREGGIVGV